VASRRPGHPVLEPVKGVERVALHGCSSVTRLAQVPVRSEGWLSPALWAPAAPAPFRRGDAAPPAHQPPVATTLGWGWVGAADDGGWAEDCFGVGRCEEIGLVTGGQDAIMARSHGSGGYHLALAEPPARLVLPGCSLCPPLFRLTMPSWSDRTDAR